MFSPSHQQRRRDVTRSNLRLSLTARPPNAARLTPALPPATQTENRRKSHSKASIGAFSRHSLTDLEERVNVDRKARIICTLGPSSSSAEVLEAMMRAGMDVARLNFSHGTHHEHRARVDLIRKISKKVGKPIALLQDVQGPKVRL